MGQKFKLLNQKARRIQLLVGGYVDFICHCEEILGV